MKHFLQSVLCLISAVALCFTVVPIVSQVSADTIPEYVVWDANTDLVLEDAENGLTPGDLGVTSAFVMHKGKDETERYYTADFSAEGKGGITQNAIFMTGITASEAGFGWMANNTFIKKISNLIISFDYRVSSEQTIPSDAKLILTAAATGNANVCSLASVQAADAAEWTTVTMPVGSAFTMFWEKGYINVYLSSESGGLTGGQKIGLKNIRLSVKEDDRLAFNSALTKASFANIDNFSAGVTMKQDSKGNKDYFALMTAYDEKSAYGGGTDATLHSISATCTDGADYKFSRKKAKDGDIVTVYTETEDRFSIESVTAVGKGGIAVPVNTGAKNVRYSFEMPDEDVALEIKTTRMADPNYILLWYCDPPTQQWAPYFTGVAQRPYAYSLVDGGDRTAWEFNITNNMGTMTLYGKENRTFKLERYYETAMLTMRAKLTSEDGNHMIRLASNKNEPITYEIEVGSDWTDISVPLRDVTGNKSIDFLTFDLSCLSVGDILSLAEVCIWNREVPNSEKGFESVLDMSDYQKYDSNTLIGVIGDTEADIDPWNELRNTIPEPISWDRAWYYQFQNMSAWALNPQPDNFGNEYNITFYVGGDSPAPEAPEYVDTGYMEFFCKSETDGIVFPIAVNGKNSAGRVYVPVYIRYQKAKARPDGWMCVRVPFRYLYDMGLDMTQLDFVSVKGKMVLSDVVAISSFRFYSRYADVPEPEPIVEPEPEPERDLPIELDSSVLNARLDKKKKIVYVPKNTKIWELLSAIVLDTEESTITFFDKEVIDDTEKTIDESMKMIIYRRGYYLDRFDIQIPITGTVLRRTNVTREEMIHSDETEVTPIYSDDIENGQPQISQNSPNTGDLGVHNETGNDTVPIKSMLLVLIAMCELFIAYSTKKILYIRREYDA